MIKCACLLQLNDEHNKILLVRVRDNEKWYLPGGKIESFETAEDCLIREIKEELGVNLIIPTIKFRFSWQDRAYGIDDTVELNCFTASFNGAITPTAEVSEVRYVDWTKESHILAPAILSLSTSSYLEKIKN